MVFTQFCYNEKRLNEKRVRLVNLIELFVFSEELSQQDIITGDPSIPSTSGANVVVLSQPEEMVSMATYHHQPEEREEIVYDSELLQTGLVSEDIDPAISEHELGISQQLDDNEDDQS